MLPLGTIFCDDEPLLSTSLATVVTDEGERWFLRRVLNQASQANLRLRLYTNNVELSEGLTADDLDEASVAGYSEKILTGRSFSIASGTATYPEQVFHFTSGPESIRGYYVTDPENTTVLWAGQFEMPAYIPSDGGSLRVAVRLEAD